MHFDVAVVGLGMAGASTAIALAQQGFRVAAVDATAVHQALYPAATSVDSMDLRVVALSQQAIRLLENIGVWRHLPAEAKSFYHDMAVWDAEGTARVSFSAAEVKQAYLGCLIENRVLISALHQQLLRSGVTLMTESKVASIESHDHSKIVTLENQQSIQAEILIGADGGNSRVREWLGVDVHTADNHQRAIVCNVATAKPHDQVARQRFLSTGPLAFLPMQAAADNICSIVWSCDNGLAEQLASMSDTAFSQALVKAFEDELGDIEQVSARAQFPLVVKHAQTYAKQGVYLVGDAAHVIHPLAGQGINLGFQDVEALIGAFESAKRRGLTVANPRIEAQYQRARKAENLRMIAVTQGFKSLFGRKELGVRWLRNQGMRFVNGNSQVRRAIIAGAMGLNS